MKDVSYNVIRSTLKVKIESMAQEFHAAFCNADLESYNAHKIIKDRSNRLKQQVQHQVNVKCQFDGICPCLRHNLLPCKIKNCLWRHVCRCGASDQIMTPKN